MRRDYDIFDGNDDDLDGDETSLKLYPLEERPFSQAWRRAIGFKFRLYESFFPKQDSNLISERSYRAWEPHVARIKKDLDKLPKSDAVFIGALVSFYNADTGGRLLRGVGVQGMGDIATSLDLERRQILAELMVSYVGW